MTNKNKYKEGTPAEKIAKILDDYRNDVLTKEDANRYLKKLSVSHAVNPLRKGARGPIAGKPKPRDAQVIHSVNKGMTQFDTADKCNLEDERQVRRIVTTLKNATKNRFARANYEKGINSKLLQELHSGNDVDVDNYLHIYSANWNPNGRGGCPELLTKKEVFKRLDDAHMAAIKAMTGKEPD